MKDILFNCYTCKFDEGETTIFLFWPDGEWDENKYMLEEALQEYPVEKFNWVKAKEE